MNEQRGYRYQAEEAGKISDRLKTSKKVEADIEYEEEINEVVSQLSKHGIFKIEDMDIDKKAVDPEDNPDYYGRLGFCTRKASKNEVSAAEVLYVDFFFTDVPDYDEDELMWGS